MIVPTPSITNVVTEGNFGNLIATKKRPIVIGTHDLNTDPAYRAQIEVYAIAGDPFAGYSGGPRVKGITRDFNYGRNWYCQVFGSDSYYPLNNYILSAQARYIIYPTRRNSSTVYVYKSQFSNNFPFKYFGDMSGPPILYINGNTVQKVNEWGGASLEKGYEVIWRAEKIETLICQISNPTETIVVVNREKGWPPYIFVPGLAGQPIRKISFPAPMFNDTRSIAIPFIDTRTPEKKRDRSLYKITRPIVFTATGPLGTITKETSFTSLVRKSTKW